MARIILFVFLAITAGCNMASRDARGESFFGYGDPAGTFSSGGESQVGRAEYRRVDAVEAPRSEAAAESQRLAALARYEVVVAMRECLTGERRVRRGDEVVSEEVTCRVPPAAWTDIPEVSRGLAVDEAITVSASDGSGYGSGADAWYQAQTQMGGSHAVPGWVSGNSQEVLQRLEQLEAETAATREVQRVTSEELAGHLDRNRRSRRER